MLPFTPRIPGPHPVSSARDRSRCGAVGSEVVEAENQRRGDPDRRPDLMSTKGIAAVMKITNVQAIPVAIPAPGFRSALGVHRVHEYGIVVVETDAGIEGVGEISMIWDGNGYLQCHFVDT